MKNTSVKNTTSSKGSLAFKLTALATGAGAGALAPQADAAVVPATGVVLTVPNPGSNLVTWDLDGAGSNPGFTLSGQRYSTFTNAVFAGVSTIGGQQAQLVATASVLRQLPGGYVVGPANSWRTFLGSLTAFNVLAYASANWGPNPTGYFGFRFGSAGNFKYGYGTLTISPGADAPSAVLTITSAFYDNAVNTPIVIPLDAGPAGVPEPSSIALLALGAAGVAAWRRRRAA